MVIRAFAQDDGAQHSGVDHRRLCERVPDRHPPVDDLAVGVQRGTTGLDSCSEDQGVVQLITATRRNRESGLVRCHGNRVRRRTKSPNSGQRTHHVRPGTMQLPSRNAGKFIQYLDTDDVAP